MNGMSRSGGRGGAAAWLPERCARPLRHVGLVAAAALLLAGCAGGAPAPVEDRVSAGAPVSAEAGNRTPGADRGADPGVTVRALPDRGPRREDAPAPSAAGGAGDTPAAPPNPAVIALINRANREAGAGRHDTAAASLERALKIEPGNAWLWHRLAAVRLDQGRARDAESLAARSNALASGDAELQARNWRLIAQVRRLRGEDAAARDAERRARELSGARS